MTYFDKCVTILVQGVKNKKVKVKFIVTNEFKTNKPNSTEKELKDMFNKKYFKYIMRQEKNLFSESNIKNKFTKKI